MKASLKKARRFSLLLFASTSYFAAAWVGVGQHNAVAHVAFNLY
jgi:hypothetical protein